MGQQLTRKQDTDNMPIDFWKCKYAAQTIKHSSTQLQSVCPPPRVHTQTPSMPSISKAKTIELLVAQKAELMRAKKVCADATTHPHTHTSTAGDPTACPVTGQWSEHARTTGKRDAAAATHSESGDDTADPIQSPYAALGRWCAFLRWPLTPMVYLLDGDISPSGSTWRGGASTPAITDTTANGVPR